MLLHLTTTLTWQLSQFWLEMALFPCHVPKRLLVYKLQALASNMRRLELPEAPWKALEKVVAELLKKNDPEVRWVMDRLQSIRPCRELSWVGEFWSNEELHAHVGTTMPDVEPSACLRPLMQMKHFPSDFRDGFRGLEEVGDTDRSKILGDLGSAYRDYDNGQQGSPLDDSREEDPESEPASPPASPSREAPTTSPVREPILKKQKKDKYRMAPEYAAKSKAAVLFNRDSLKGIPEGVRRQLGRWTFGK